MSADIQPKESAPVDAVPDSHITNETITDIVNDLPPLFPSTQARKCGICGVVGHNRRTCPSVPENSRRLQNAVPRRTQPSSTQTPTPVIIPPIALDKCYYIIFDIETTGFSKNHHEIIQLAAKILDENGDLLFNSSFNSLVKPNNRINDTISTLTGITNKAVASADNIHVVGQKFVHYIRSTLGNDDDSVSGDDDTDENTNFFGDKEVIWVAHNENRFDLPFLYKKIPLKEVRHIILVE